MCNVYIFLCAQINLTPLPCLTCVFETKKNFTNFHRDVVLHILESKVMFIIVRHAANSLLNFP